MQFKLRNLTGNALMAFSLLLVAFIYFPVVKMYLFPQKPDPEILKTGYYIEIPKINVLSPVIEDVDPLNKNEYIEKLKLGIAHAKGTEKPDGEGTSFLFAHSSDSPFSLTRYNTAFFRLPELKKGDIITIGYKDKKYKYAVFDTKTVSPKEIEYLSMKGKKMIILQTCVPIGTSFQRLLVFARSAS